MRSLIRAMVACGLTLVVGGLIFGSLQVFVGVDGELIDCGSAFVSHSYQYPYSENVTSDACISDRATRELAVSMLLIVGSSLALGGVFAATGARKQGAGG